MLILSISIFIIGIAILILAVRGRVVQRGCFCKHCRFDLAGIDLHADDVKCPECGSAVYDTRNQQELLRRRSAVPLVAALMMLSVSIVGAVFVLSGNTASVYAKMPDRVVVMAARMGSDAALDETMTRLSRIPPMSQSLLDSIIEHALRVQADRSQPWDLRLGQILFDEVMAQQLTDEQLQRYVLNGFRFEAHIRDRVHPGDDLIAYQIDTFGDRVGTFNGGVTPYRFGALRAAFGVEGDDPVYTGEPDEQASVGKLYVMSGNGNSSWLRTSMWMMRKYTTAPVGTTLPVYLDLKIRLDAPDREKPIFTKLVRYQQAVKIIEEHEPIVAKYENDAVAQAICAAMKIGPLYTMDSPKAPGPNSYIPIMKFKVTSDPIPESFAFSVFLRVDGREVEIGNYVQRGPRDEASGSSVQWGIAPDDQGALKDALEFHAQILQVGSADVILRTNPASAIIDPEIDRVIDTELVFHAVPIKIVQTPDEVVNPSYDQIMTNASCGEH